MKGPFSGFITGAQEKKACEVKDREEKKDVSNCAALFGESCLKSTSRLDLTWPQPDSNMNDLNERNPVHSLSLFIFMNDKVRDSEKKIKAICNNLVTISPQPNSF